MSSLTSGRKTTPMQRQIEELLAKAGKVDKKTAEKFEKQAKAFGITDTVSGVAASAATPAIAGAAGLGAGGTVALAAAFPIGTILVAIPIAVSLGLSIAKGDAEKNAKYLTKDQKHLVEITKKFRKKKSKWRVKKAKQFLKEYGKHLDWGKKKTLAPWDGNKRHRDEQGWKARKAEMEMRLTAIYIAEYKTTPPTKSTKEQQKKSRKVVRSIQRKQVDAGVPTSPYKIQGKKLLFSKPKLQRQTARMLQRPSEITRTIQQQGQLPPQTIQTTLKQSPGVLDGSIGLADEQLAESSNTGLFVASGLGALGLVGLII